MTHSPWNLCSFFLGYWVGFLFGLYDYVIRCLLEFCLNSYRFSLPKHNLILIISVCYYHHYKFILWKTFGGPFKSLMANPFHSTQGGLRADQGRGSGPSCSRVAAEVWCQSEVWGFRALASWLQRAANRAARKIQDPGDWCYRILHHVPRIWPPRSVLQCGQYHILPHFHEPDSHLHCLFSSIRFSINAKAHP